MKIYIVTSGAYSDYQIISVYSYISQEHAHKLAVEQWQKHIREKALNYEKQS
jgi:hypothetical protein